MKNYFFQTFSSMDQIGYCLYFIKMLLTNNGNVFITISFFFGQCCVSESGRVRMSWLDPDPLHETMKRIRKALENKPKFKKYG